MFNVKNAVIVINCPRNCNGFSRASCDDRLSEHGEREGEAQFRLRRMEGAMRASTIDLSRFL